MVSAQIENKKTLVLGLGKTGYSVVRFLLGRGEQVAVTDSRMEPPYLEDVRKDFPDLPLFLGKFDDSLLGHADRVVVSPGISLEEPIIRAAVAAGLSVIGDVELFAQHANAPVIAITGSNGKSTVTALVAKILEDAAKDVRTGGNFGTPALDLLYGQPDYFVLELSSFQLETTQSLKPRVAAVLNVTEDHIDRHRSFEHYTKVKARIYRNADCSVFNIDDRAVETMKVMAKRALTFSVKDPSATAHCLLKNGENYLCVERKTVVSESRMKIVGLHNVANALAALAIVSELGISLTSASSSLENFVGLPHRTQFVATIAGVDWYNDSKATNVGAAAAALSGFVRPVVLIAGGEGKNANFKPLAKAAKANTKHCVLFGRDKAILADAFASENVPVTVVSGMDQAIDTAASIAESGDVVLLSPACASFDMFSGYEHRGNVFTDLVRGRLS